MRFLDKKAITYDDVHLVPQYSDIKSRAEVDLGTALLRSKIRMRMPIFASPMDTISSPKLAISMWKEVQAMAIIHRYFASIEDQAKMVGEVVAADAVVGAAVGSVGDYVERAHELVRVGASIICVDVAHGHHSMTAMAVKTLRKQFPNLHIMAGNVATREGFEYLQACGADSIRVNVGGGSICSTRIQTGHGYPILSSILDVASSPNRTAQIIADGGMKYHGDAVKALAAGADFVMSGAFFAGTDEAPGEVIENKITGKKVKAYRGMSSKAAQVSWRGTPSSNEGVEAVVSCKGSIAEVLKDLGGSIRSGLSYSGARSLSEFREKATFVEVSTASAIEATPHILSR